MWVKHILLDLKFLPYWDIILGTGIGDFSIKGGCGIGKVWFKDHQVSEMCTPLFSVSFTVLEACTFWGWVRKWGGITQRTVSAVRVGLLLHSGLFYSLLLFCARKLTRKGGRGSNFLQPIKHIAKWWPGLVPPNTQGFFQGEWGGTEF